MSSSERIFKSSVASAASLAVRVVQQLLLVSILIIIWPTELYGEWLIISAIPIFLSLSDFGFVLAGSNELARRASSESGKSVQSFYNIYSVYFQRWSILIVFILAICSFYLPLKELMGLKLLTESEASLIFFLLSLNALVAQNSLILFAGLRAKGKTHYGLWVRVINALLRIVLAFILVWLLETSPLVLAIGMLFLGLCSYWLEWYILKGLGLTQRVNIFLPLKDKIPMKPYFTMGLEMMLIPLSQALILQGSVILIGKFLGPVYVVIFTTHRTLTRFSSSVLQVFSNPLMAEAGLMQKEEDKEQLTKIVTFLSRITFWLSIVICIGFILLGEWIYTLWVQNKIDFNFTLILILIIGIVGESLWRIITSVRIGSNRHRPIALGYFIFTILGLLIAGYLSIDYGILGVAIGVTLVDVFMMFLAIFTIRGILNISILNFILNLIIPPIEEVNNLIQKKLLKKK
jgi:O-antigen/teichoic acid export membrane protein